MKILFFLLFPLATFGQLEVVKLDSIGNSAIYRIIEKSHKENLDSTRIANGVNPLLHSEFVEKVAMRRCIRMQKIFIQNPEKFINSVYGEGGEKENIFFREIHKDYVLAENGCFTQEVLKNVNIVRDFKYFNSGNRYNKSPGHFQNRTLPIHTKYGTYTITSITQVGDRLLSITFNYEVFL